MPTLMQPPSIHVDLRCDPGVVEAADRMLDRLDSEFERLSQTSTLEISL
jgi:hypothetical protein